MNVYLTLKLSLNLTQIFNPSALSLQTVPYKYKTQINLITYKNNKKKWYINLEKLNLEITKSI